MKKIIVVIALLFIAAASNGQLVKTQVLSETKIGTEKRGLTKFAELSYGISPSSDTIYHLFYKDENYKQMNEWKSLFFKGGYLTLNDLYKTMTDALDADKGKENTFTLGEISVFISTAKMLGSKYLTIQFTDASKVTSMITITKPQLKSLFSVEN